MSRPAAFLDRDGTIIRDTGYVGSPGSVELIPGASSAISRLNQAGIPVVVITNQSGIARGMYTADDYERVRARLDELLIVEGARVDATYMCPHHPQFTGPCECRKPGTLLFRQAAASLGLSLERSFYVGDQLRDVQPATELGGTGLLVRGPHVPAGDVKLAFMPYQVVASLDEAVRRILESAR